MEIKRRQRRSGAAVYLGQALASSNRRSVLIGCAVAAGALLFFSMGYFLHDQYKPKIDMVRVYSTHLVQKMRASQRAKPEHLTLDIKFKDYMKLSHAREEALSIGVLVSSPDDFVPARIRHKEKTIKAKIRLKGDWTDHLKTDKWSFRVRLKSGEALMGMREFSLQHPGTRRYIHEWIYHAMLRGEDILAPRYDFVRVTINGRDSGVYALEEHFDKVLVESRNRREGPILKLNEDLLWEERRLHFSEEDFSPPGYSHEAISPVTGFRMGKQIADAQKRKLYVKASGLLEGFRRGALPAAAVFDVKRMAVFLAINDLTGASHGSIWHNLRFYYNPISSRLEPIAFDGQPGRRFSTPARPGEGLIGALLADNKVYREYVAALERVAAPGYLSGFFQRVSASLGEKMDILHTDYPGYPLTPERYESNRQAIAEALYPIKSVHAFFQKKEKGQIRLKIANIQKMPVDIYGISWQGRPHFPVLKRITLDPINNGEGVRYISVKFKIPSTFKWRENLLPELRLGYRISGTQKERSDAIFPWPYPDQTGLEQDLLRRSSNEKGFPFLRVDQVSRQIHFKRGVWKIERPLILPAGFTVVCGEGTRIVLEKKGIIISRSRLRFRGSESAPIIIESPEGAGHGVAVLGAPEESELQWVKAVGLSAPIGRGWALTGGITFYESPVSIAHSEFLRSKAEDSLNIIRTRFKIEKTLFSRAQSDALDVDFSNGTLHETAFTDSGNDAIDISGSQVALEDIQIRGAGDKGISAGEISTLTGKNIRISRAVVGAASKDVSVMTLTDIRISDSRIGLTAYRKKPEFGGGVIKADNVDMTSVEYPVLVEAGSSIVIDNMPELTSPSSVLKILEAFK